MARWIAEISGHAVAQVLRDYAAKPLDVRGTAALKALTTSRCSSGSRRAESALEPTMSQNMMVSWRRSGDADWSQLASCGFRLRTATIQASRLTPHSGQNFALGGLSLPKARHLRDRAEPHSAQNFADCGTGALQFGHSTSVAHTIGLHTLTQSCRAKYADESPNKLSSSAFGQHDRMAGPRMTGRNWHSTASIQAARLHASNIWDKRTGTLGCRGGLGRTSLTRSDPNRVHRKKI